MKLLFYFAFSFFTLFSFAQTWQNAYDSCLKYQEKHQYKKAVEWGDKTLELYEKQVVVKDTNYNNILSTQIENCYAASLYKQGEIYAKRDSAFTKQIKNEIRYAGSCNNLAKLYYSQSRYKEAEPLYKESKEIREKVLGREHPDYAESCNNLAKLYYSQGRYAEAELLYKESKEIIAKVLGKEHRYYSLSCNNLAGLYKTQGRYAESESLYKESKEINAKVLGKEHPQYASSCNNLALLYYIQGRYAEAEPLYKEAASIYTKVLGKEHPDYAASCNNLARLYYSKGFYAEAEPLYKEAASIRAKVFGKGHPEYAASCNNLAGLYKTQGRYAEAEQLFKETAAIYAKVQGKEHPYYAASCNNLAKLYYTQARYAEAESLYKEATAINAKVLGKDHPEYAACCNNLAELYKAQRRYAEAEPLYKEAASIYTKSIGKKHPYYAVFCNNLAGVCYYQGRYAESELLYKEAKEIIEKIFGKEHPDYAHFCNNLAGLYMSQSHYTEAEPLYQEAISAKFKEIEQNFKSLSETEKESYVKTNIENYFNNFLYFVCKRYTQSPVITEYAYNLVLNTKGLILQSTEKIKNRILNSKDENLKKLYLEWKLTKDKYAKTLTLTTEQRKQKKLNLDSLAQRANELEKQLALKSEDFAKTFTPKAITWKDIQNALKKDQAVIEMVRVNAKENKPDSKDSIIYLALIIRKTSKYPEIMILPNGNDLEGSYLTNYRRTITSKVQDKESYNAFWKPLKTTLKGIKTVYFSPDGIYHQINLATLQNPETKKYVADEVQIINVTNSKDILDKQKFTSKNSYLIGNPKFNLEIDTKNNEKPFEQRSIENLSQLEGAEKEVKQISTILPNAKTTIGTDATEEYVKSLKNPRILHIATHGYFKKGQYQSSTQAMLNAGLLFAGVMDYDRMDIRPFDKEDGKLTAFEVMNMELDSTELVVLSACETGLGQASKEGVYGLQRAFKVAGAQSIIMSLWKVNDEATQLLMTKFYENWQKKGMDKRKAFETAQKDLRKQYKEPYYWGAFVMIE